MNKVMVARAVVPASPASPREAAVLIAARDIVSAIGGMARHADRHCLSQKSTVHMALSATHHFVSSHSRQDLLLKATENLDTSCTRVRISRAPS